MERRARAGFVSLLLVLGVACGASTPGEASGCDQLFAELDAARDAAQTYTMERVEGLSDSEIAELPEDPEETRLHAEVDRAYEAWQAAGCDQ